MGHLELESDGHVVRLRGEVLSPLPRMEFELLRTLMTHPNRILAPARLQSLVWGPDSGSTENTVAVHVARLRRRLEDDPHKPTMIRTVRGVGYVLWAEH